MTRLITVLALLLLTACGSTSSTRLYVLQPLAQNSSTNLEVAVGIGPITLPEYVDRPQLVTTGGGHDLRYSDFDRWAEPLDDAMYRLLIENISRLTGSPYIKRFPWRSDEQPELVIRADVFALDVNRDGQAILRCNWRLVERISGKVLVHHQSELQEAAGSGYNAQARAYSDLLLQLSTEMASAIRNSKS